ncbi:MAG: YtxH domain-containing protein [Chloroflexi bacterium]|nr:YtxH domain-containing protein [Chloroflexota bacterium]
MNTDSAKSFGYGLIAGAAIGLAIGFLYAPRPGRETRQVIRDKTGAVIEKAKEKVAQAKEKVAHMRGKSDGELEEAIE